MSLRALVAARLRALRLRRGLSQERLAGSCGISVGHVSMLERGIRAPSLATLETLATALGVSPLRLLEEPPPSPAGRRPPAPEASVVPPQPSARRRVLRGT